MTTALLYCRVSTQEQATEGYSLDAQARQLERYCATQTWEVGARYIEEGWSAKSLSRPQLGALLADLQAGRYREPCVVVWRLDRLTRSVSDLYELLSMFERAGSSFKSITEPFETTSAFGKLFVTLIAAMAQWERETLIERVRLGQMHQVTQTANWVGGRPPYGYLLQGKRLVVDDGAARVVARVYDGFLRDGNLSALARRLNAEGVPPPGAGGRGWTATRLRYILTNPVYAGLRTWRRHARVHGESQKGSYRRAPREHWLWVDGQGYGAIVSRDAWERACEVLERPGRVPRRRGWGAHPLTGVLTCGVCGSPMNGRQTRRGAKVYRYYRCPGRERRRVCDMAQVRAEGLEAVVRAAIGATFAEDSLVEHALLESRDAQEGAERRRLASTLDTVRRRMRRWEDAFEHEAIDARTLATRLRELRAAEREVVQRLTDLRPEGAEAVGTATRDGWLAMTPAERKEFVQDLVARVVVYRDGTVDIAWR